MSPRSGREDCAPSPPPRCCGAEVRGASPARARRSGHGLCLPLLPPGSAPPAGGRLLVPQRPAVRSRCSGGDSRELGDARCPHGQAVAARTSPALLQRLPVLLKQECAKRMPRVAGVVNLTQVAGGCGQGRPTAPGSPSPTTVAEAPALVAPLFAAHAPCCGSPWLVPARSRSREPPHPPPTVRSSLFLVSPLSPTEGLWTPRPAIRLCGRQPHSPAKKDLGSAAEVGEQGCVGTGRREPKKVTDSDFKSQLAAGDVKPWTLMSLRGITAAKAVQSAGQRRPPAPRVME